MNIDVPPCTLGSSQHAFMPGSRVCFKCWWCPTPAVQPLKTRRRPSALDKVLRHWGDRCVFCRAVATTRDHLVPRSRGGRDHLSNLRPCCKRCNTAKADMTPAEWLGEACPEEFMELTAPRPRAEHEVKRQAAAMDRAKRTQERQRRAELIRSLAG